MTWGARPKQVLEILLAARGHHVATDRLADLLWPEQRPQNTGLAARTRERHARSGQRWTAA